MTWREPESQTGIYLHDEDEEGHEPTTKDDEFAREDAPEQEYEDD